jgi:hypothetical protein
METPGFDETQKIAIQRLQLLANSPYRSSLPTVPLEDSRTKNEDTPTLERELDRGLILLALISNGPESQRGLASLSPSRQDEITSEDTPSSIDPNSLFSALDISKCDGYCNKRDAASNNKWIVVKTSQMANAAATGCQGCALLKRCCETILGFEFDVAPIPPANESQESEASDEPYLPVLISGKFYFKKGGIKEVEAMDELHTGKKRIYFRLEPTIQFSVGGENEVKFESITIKQV